MDILVSGVPLERNNTGGKLTGGHGSNKEVFTGSHRYIVTTKQWGWGRSPWEQLGPHYPCDRTDLVQSRYAEMIQCAIASLLSDPLSNVKLRSFGARYIRLVAALAFAIAGSVSARIHSPSFDSTTLLTPQPISFKDCKQFFANGRPPALPPASRQRELCYEEFAVLHDAGSRTPLYVAQRLNRKTIEGADERRADSFFADARLPAGERAELEDYKRSGYSRGHMAPAGDMSTPTAMAQSFSLANMVPQNIQHNAGAWAKIEQDTRRYVLRAKGDVYVITGPVFSKDSPVIGRNAVRVPAYLYKLVYDASTQRAWAHWQANREGETVSPPISYRELVRRTGIDFLPRQDLD